MALSFKERMAQRAAQIASGEAPTTPLATEEAPANGIKDTDSRQHAGTGTQSTVASTGGFSRFKANTAGDTQTKSAESGGFKSRFGTSVEAPSTTQSSPQAVAKKEERPEPLPKVIQAFNAIGTKPVTLGEAISGLPPKEAVLQIQQKIADISLLEDGTDIRYEMEKLSELLLANPQACLYLLDEDLGLAVRALRKMTDNKVAIDMGKAKPRKGSADTGGSRKLSAAEMAAALDDL